jgi:drug/metabolite transporter (DMT)-like permease
VSAGRSRLATHGILVGSQLCFASLAVVGRMAVIAHVPPAGIVLVRMLGGAVAFTLIAYLRGGLRSSGGAGGLARGDRAFFFLLAILGVVLNQELFIHGLARTTATNAVVLGSTIPVFTALTAIALRYEPVSPRRLLGIAVAFTGCVLLVGPDELSLSSSHLAGSVMILINAACYGVYLAIARKVSGRYDPMTILAILFVIGVPLVAPLGVHAWTQAAPLTANAIAFLAFLILVPTVGAYSLIQIALRRAESSLVASYIYLQPIFATAGAALLLDERPGGRTALAAAVVLGGVWISAMAKPGARPAANADAPVR